MEPTGTCTCTCVTHWIANHAGSVGRWFDKSLNLIVTKNGLSAINFEHAWGDGVAVLRFFNELFTHTTTKPYIPSKHNILCRRVQIEAVGIYMYVLY